MKKDNDIKEMFAHTAEGGISTDIEAEKIKNSVMERLNKEAGGIMQLSEAEKEVKPIYSSEFAKKSHRLPLIAATSAAAAVCLGITALSMGFLDRGKVITSAEGKNTSDNGEMTEVTVYEVQTENGADTDNTAAEETTYDYEIAKTEPGQPFTPAESEPGSEADLTYSAQQPEETESYREFLEKYRGERSPFKNTSFFLLDGTHIEIGPEGQTSLQDYGSNMQLLLSEVGGRLYYWNGREKKDITDFISANTFYVDSYENEASGLTHYILIGGDITSGLYGYAEVFPIYERDWAICFVANQEEVTPNVNMDRLEENRDKALEVVNTLAKEFIRQKTGIEEFITNGGGGAACFKEVVLPCDK